MLAVNVLAGGYRTPSGRAFIYPLFQFHQQLSDAGISVKCYFRPDPAISECDLLAIDSKYYRSYWRSGAARVLEDLQRHRARIPRVYWFDNADSTGSLQTAVIPFVDAYCKAHLLRDVIGYSRPWYGGRIYTDYYHTKHGVTDDQPIWSTPVTVDSDLRKLRVSWNSAFWNYSYSRVGEAIDRAFSFFARRPRFNVKRKWARPGGQRSVTISARFSMKYARRTVAYQRGLIRARLGDLVPQGRLSRTRFRQEMEDSKMVISPFGWGEFAYRDYECFIAGSVLVKPDISHVKTWPDLYQAHQTYVPVSWNTEEMLDVVHTVEAGYQKYTGIARCGQEQYRSAIVGRDAGERFAEHAMSLFKQPASSGS